MASNLTIVIECSNCGHSNELIGTKEACKKLPKPVHFGSLTRYALQKRIPSVPIVGGDYFREIDLLNFIAPVGGKKAKTNDTTATS